MRLRVCVVIGVAGDDMVIDRKLSSLPTHAYLLLGSCAAQTMRARVMLWGL
jgi:hypothetical protein